jgi:kumamolisin
MKTKKSRTKQTVQRLHHVTIIVRHGPGEVKPVDHMFSAFHERRPKPPADEKDLDRITEFLRSQRLDVVEASAHKRTVIVRGTKTALRRVFAPTGKHVPPAELREVVLEVIGPSVGARARLVHKMAPTIGSHADPLAVASHYNFPPQLKGENQCIALVMLGGGYHESDLDLYFKRLNLTKPKISVVETPDARNNPSSPKDIEEFVTSLRAHRPTTLSPAAENNAWWTRETTQDIQLLGTFANNAHIVVYFGTNDYQGRFNALSSAIFDQKFSPSVVCCSWHIGFEQDKKAVTDTERNRLDDLLELASELDPNRSVSVCFSSGDSGDGSKDSPRLKHPKVCYPASNPYVLACGGTDLVLAPEESETVWSESAGKISLSSGGGCSRLFETPWWQDSNEVVEKAGFPGRGVPDVAAKANFVGGYLGILGGIEISNGGTSASAPLWASLIAILNQALGTRLGFVNPLLYRDEIKRVLNPIVKGSNGAYHASKGWNPCTGLGTPDTAEILAKLKDLAESLKVRGLAAKAAKA